MNIFNWFFRSNTTKKNQPANKLSNMREPTNLASPSASDIEDELKRLSVIRIQIRTAIPGVIEGMTTIPLQVPVTRTWEQVFSMAEVQMDPVVHQLRAYGKPIEDLKSLIYDYFIQFKRNRSTYLATIVARPLPKLPKKVMKRKRKVNKKKAVSQTPAVDKSFKSVAKKVVTKRTSTQRRTRSQRIQEAATRPKLPTPTGSQNGPNANMSEAEQNLQLMQKLQGPSGSQVNNPADNPSNAVNAFRISKARLTLGMLSQEVGMQRTTIPNRTLLLRDESTMAGDMIRPEEQDIKAEVMKYFLDHCSNRDMLNIRDELRELKRIRKFQALNRLIPFTSGFLQNTFLDVHESNNNGSNGTTAL